MRKPFHGARHVESKAVLSDPTTTSHPDSRHFSPLQPNTRKAWDALALQIQCRQHIDHHLFELAHVPMKVWFTPAKVQHRIGHQLPGGVVGDLPSPVDAIQGSWRILGIKAQVIFGRTTTKGEARRMLKKPNRFPV